MDKRNSLIKADAYDIFIGDNSLNELSDFISPQKKNFILADDNTLKHCLPLLTEKIKLKADVIKIKSGEKNKTIDTVKKIWEELTKKGADRNSLFINLGGGVICDMGGFAAASFKRGIDFINIPTSLLAMVDASFGGKTGIDFYGIKNQIGVFRNPAAVFIYPDFLKTLPVRELLAAFAEIFKHALIMDVHYWKYLKSNLHLSLILDNKMNNVDWAEIVCRSVMIKNKVVKADPLEKNVRKILNFGHTIGHAIEAYSLMNDKVPLLHGEAVALGIICEAFISTKKSGLSYDEFNDIVAYVYSFFPKYKLSIAKADEIVKLMEHDKKNIKDEINFSFLKSIGECLINKKSDNSDIIDAIKFYNSLS